MAKQNVKLPGLGTWDQFMAQDLDAGAAQIYAWAGDTYRTVSTWYWASIRAKRIAALTVRASTMLLVVVATVLQTLSAIQHENLDKLVSAQAVLCALAIAGLLQLADRVFGWSSGWTRYITTVNAVESATRAFVRQWRGALLVNGRAVTLATLFELAKAYEETLVALQAVETNAWAAEFNQGTQLLNDSISRMRVENSAALDAAALPVAVKDGVIQLTFNAGAHAGPLFLAIEDGAPFEVGASFATRLKVGPYHAVVKAAATAGPGTSFAFTVAPDAVTLVTVELPSQ